MDYRSEFLRDHFISDPGRFGEEHRNTEPVQGRHQRNRGANAAQGNEKAQAKEVRQKLNSLPCFSDLPTTGLWIILAIRIHIEEAGMKTIQMTLDDELVDDVDNLVRQLHTSRSAFTREALRDALDKYKNLQLEEKHRQGYRQKPVAGAEFSVWEDEQEWGGA